MRCFDILNIPETATVEEIDSAFSTRIKNLEKNSDGIVKISLWGSRTSKHFRYDNAVRENQRLESQKGPALQQVSEARAEKQQLEQRSVEIHAYTSFMGAMGCNSATELLAIEESIISQKSEEVQIRIETHEDILRRIERNNQIIQQGRN